MTTRMVPVLLLTAMLYALGAGVANLPYGSATAAASASANATPAALDVESIPVLPTVTVRPDADALTALVPAAVLLPTVSVRPGAAEIAAAKAIETREIGAGAIVVAMRAMGGGLAPRSGLDMPYYSFGKSVYRLRKE
jgi:hypothetical protein